MKLSQNLTLTLALAQVQGNPEPEQNLKTARQFASEARLYGADMLIFPEMFMALPQKHRSLTTVAESVNGAFVTSMREMAKQYQLYIVSGIWEKITGDTRVHNTAVILSPEGEYLTCYQKLHLFDALNIRESDNVIPGNRLPEVVDIKGFHVSLAICYDLRFPELFREAARQGADLVIIPSGWYSGTLKEAHWLTLLRARAIENTLYIAGVNLTGTKFCGRSAVFDPFGVQKAGAGESPELLVTHLKSERITEVRSKLPLLQHCRGEFYFHNSYTPVSDFSP